ncbi:MAG: peptidylprolyl isomerase [Candidatus Vogelbacteria bacterium]|nr:peptidylprolyl isomerase [Candidatus Vogelbacteria bacterium]
MTDENKVQNSTLITPETKEVVKEETANNTTSKANVVVIKTSMGNVKLELYPEKAPLTVENFLKLSKSAFYEGTKFHRVIKDFMIQGGDPNSKNADWSTHGMGGPGYQFKDEINDIKLVAGVLAMANSGPDTNGSQFFIVTAPATPWLDGRHTAFGRVVEGMDVVRAIENVEVDHVRGDHPIKDIVVEKVIAE